VLPIAHAGHWFFWILYAVPVIVVLASIVTSLRRERRQAAAEAGGGLQHGEGDRDSEQTRGDE
jgi:cytochrome c-type biogenesis protein CcmH/NrfF